MPTFNIKDSKTGMEIRVSGQSAPQESDIPQLFNAAKINAEEQLATGAYKQTSDFQKISKPDQYKRIQKLAAAAIGTSVDDIDVNSGMGLWERTKLDFMPDERSRMEYLEKKFGSDNVSALNVGGNTKMFYRDPKTNKMTMVDEMGASLADFTADIAGEAVTTAGAIGGAIAGSALGPGGTIAGATAGAALGGFLTGVTQDVASEVAAGQEVDIGDITKRRGIEAVIGIPIDLVTGGASRILGRAFAKRQGVQAIDDLRRSAQELNERLQSNIKLTAAQASDPDASIRQSQRAGLDPSGREAKWYGKQLDEIGRIDQAIKTGVASDEPIEGVMARLADDHLRKLDEYRAQIDELDNIALREQAAGKKQKEAFVRSERAKLKEQRQMEHGARVVAYEKQFDKMQKRVAKLDRVRGKEVRKQVETKYRQAVKQNDDLYEEAYRRTDTARANTPVAAVARAIDRIDESQFIPDSPELMALKAMRKRMAENTEDLTFRELDAFVRQFGDRVNFKKKHGLKFNEISFRNAYQGLNKLWETAIGAPKTLGARGAGLPAQQAHRAARKDFRENVLPYTDGEPAQILQKRAGGLSGETLADEKVLDVSLGDSASVRNAIKAGADRQTLKNGYLSRILESAEGGRRITYDANVLDELYKTSKGRAAQVKKNIQRLNKMLDDAKIKPESVTKDDLFEVIDSYNPPALAQAERALKQKAEVAKQHEEATKNVLMKVIRGEQPAPEDIHIFIDDIAKLRPSQIESLKGRLSPSEQKSLARSGIDWFLDKAGRQTDATQRTTAQTGGVALWEPDAMQRLLGNKVQRSKLDALIGKDIVADYERANRVLGASSIIRDTGQKAGSRVVLTTGASGVPMPLIVSPGIPRWLGRKILGIINTSPTGQFMLRRWLQKPNEESAEDLMQKIFFTAIATRSGMASAADEARKDPQFAAWLEESFADGQGGEGESTGQ